MTDIIRTLYESRIERDTRPIASLLERTSPGTRRSVLELAIAVRRQCLRQALPFGTRLRHRRTGRTAVYVGSKPFGFVETIGSTQLSGWDTTLVWVLDPTQREPGVSQAPLSDWELEANKGKRAA